MLTCAVLKSGFLVVFGVIIATATGPVSAETQKHN
jgi:hypothetical protein